MSWHFLRWHFGDLAKILVTKFCQGKMAWHFVPWHFGDLEKILVTKFCQGKMSRHFVPWHFGDLEKFLVRKNIAQVWESPCTDEEIYRCMGPSMSALHIYCISKNTNYQQPNWKVAVLFCLKGKTKTSVEVLAKGNAAERSKCIVVSYYHCRLYP